MRTRIGVALAICFCLTRLAAAQVVRFETTMGDFDMVLNPTHNSNLQGYVDNLLKYVNSDRYLGSWINRSDKFDDGTPFVLQMGGLFSNTKRPPLTTDSTRPVAAFAPVKGVDAATNGVSNTVGTVSLALSNSPDSGTSSFFVNLGDNSGLDARGFTPFAQISDMSVISKIAALNTVDLTTNTKFGADSQNLTFTDVPVQADGKEVFIKRAFVVSDTSTVVAGPSIATLAGTSTTQQLNALSASAMSGALTASSSSADLALPAVPPVTTSDLSTGIVPEPTSLMMALLGAMAAGFCRGRRRS